MSNSNFTNYVTGGAFQLSLSRRQIDALCYAEILKSIPVKNGFVGYHSESVLIRKGLLEPDTDNSGQDYDYYKLSEAGKLVYQLLDMAGLVFKTPEPAFLPAPEVDFNVELKEPREKL